MRVICTIMNFYWSHSIVRIRNLRFFALASNNSVHNLIKREVSREKLFATDDRRQTDRQIHLRSNTHGCELTSEYKLHRTRTNYLDIFFFHPLKIIIISVK